MKVFLGVSNEPIHEERTREFLALMKSRFSVHVSLSLSRPDGWSSWHRFPFCFTSAEITKQLNHRAERPTRRTFNRRAPEKVVVVFEGIQKGGGGVSPHPITNLQQHFMCCFKLDFDHGINGLSNSSRNAKRLPLNRLQKYIWFTNRYEMNNFLLGCFSEEANTFKASL